MKFSKKIVSLIITLNILFAIAILIVFWHTSSEPSSLVVAWFAFTTGELWAMASIKKNEKDTTNSDEVTEENLDDSGNI